MRNLWQCIATRWFGIGLILSGVLITLSGCHDRSENTASTPSVPTPTEEKPAPVVRIGASATHLPPYFIHQENGIEVDIIREAFQKTGYDPQFYFIRERKEKFYAPNSKLDCISTVTKKAKQPGFYSDEVISYHDVVIYLADKGFHINRIEDLADKSIETFSDAKKHLGIADVVKNNPLYHERSGKASQIVLFFRRRVDVLIMDRYFFRHFRKRVAPLVDIKQKVIINDSLFSKRPYRILCKNEKVRNDFNRGLATLRAKGRYAEIVKQYIE
ncbi:MAG: hypothetical protein DRR08_29860 [Candidatus Parabeggiatoa sp. nov. 2]|nr:MAG: hypothetical protein B6247_28205 [Beggiatoa sp. 4572_84]RKZ50852.1 MAG: hypothetical protein DRR08_29860 [Gammaproteobacteria bacterium]